MENEEKEVESSYAVDSMDYIEQKLTVPPRKGTKAWNKWKQELNQLMTEHNRKFGKIYTMITK